VDSNFRFRDALSHRQRRGPWSRIVRGILLKGNGATEILPELWPIAAFTLVVGAIAIWAYRETLD